MRSLSYARAEKNANVRELRLGLVCYGGVSLAIYMHGITKEIQKLVIASRAFERDSNANPFDAASSEHAYWEALKVAHGRSQDVIVRVVVDVVAGTSAGGINGVILCKALAHNRSQDPLRQLWFEKGDIRELLGGSRFREWLRLTAFATELPFNKAHPPLDGAAMLGWLLDALAQVDRAPSSYRPLPGESDSLMPEGHRLQLLVTATDYHGYRQYMTISDPPTVAERRNRHRLEFAYERGESPVDQLGEAHNVPLAFASRATSSFPGAFPPIHIGDVQAKLASVDGFKQEFFRAYELSGADAGNTYFIDGGVLNNYPFQPAIQAIVKSRAESEVDRYLLYLQPDPGSEVVNPQGEEPTFFGAVWAGLSSVAAGQPIVDELVAARTFNERVRRIAELVAQTGPTVTEILAAKLAAPLGAKLADASQQDLAAQRADLEQEAARRAGYLYDPYLQIRVHSVVEQFATGICDLCGYRVEDSNVAYLIRLIIDAWATDRKLVGEGADRVRQQDLLARFDLGYTRRRCGFVIQGINDFYRTPDAPPRAGLNKAKAALYDGIEELSGLIAGASLGGGMKERLLEVFPLAPLVQAIAESRPLAALAASFVKDHGAALDEIERTLGDALKRAKDTAHYELYQAFREITVDWTPEQRQEVVVRYLGFPFWDAMIYPATRLSEAGELREIKILRVSPADSTRLGRASAREKLQGVKLAHFGAFFHREWRENDYLWGRLDAAERLIGLLLRDPAAGRDGFRAEDWEVKPVLAAILAEEEKQNGVPNVAPLVAELRERISRLPDAPRN